MPFERTIGIKSPSETGAEIGFHRMPSQVAIEETSFLQD